jgi:hypothetical protein
MVRDGRLLIAMLLFAGSSIAWLAQAAILWPHVNAIVVDARAGYAMTFPVEPPLGAGEEYGQWACLDDCIPAYTFLAGWIGIAAFLVGWLILARAWWKPKAFKEPA